jgi:hypothetical protein
MGECGAFCQVIGSLRILGPGAFSVDAWLSACGAFT